MEEHWATEEQDLLAAREIIEHHLELSGGKPLSLIEIVEDLDASLEELEETRGLSFVVPDWLVDLTDYFIEQYGVEEGRIITERVLTRYLLEGQTIH